MSGPKLVGFILAVALPLCARPAPQRGPSSAAASATFTLQAKTRHVLVDVIARDKRGRPIVNLSAKDFEVFEKVGWVHKVPQQVASFRYVSKSRTASAVASADLMRTPSGVYSNLAAAREPDVPLTILVLDSLNTNLFAPDIRRQISKMIDSMRYEGPLEIMLLDAKLYMLQDFTDDASVSRATLQKFFAAGPFAIMHIPVPTGPSPAMQQQFGVATAPSSLPQLQDWDRLTDSGNMNLRVQLTLDSIRVIARHAAGYPGRKKLVWISSSFPISIMPDPSASGADAESYYNQVVEVANSLSAARVAMYPIRPGGLFVSDIFSAGRRDRPQSSRGRAYGVSEELQRQSAAESAANTSMEEFASQTGGQTCVGDNDLGYCLQKALDDDFSYYELGYYPPAESWKQGFHRIEISTRRSGVHLRFRRGYYAGPEQEIETRASGSGGRADKEMKQAACDDVMTATALPLTVRPQASATTGDVDYSVTVDGKSLTTVVAPGRDKSVQLHLDFGACVFNKEGKALRYMQYPAEQELNQQEYAALQEHGIRRIFEFHPVAGVAQLRWLVRDQLSGALGSVDVPYQPPSVLSAVAQSVDSKPEAKSAEPAEALPVEPDLSGNEAGGEAQFQGPDRLPELDSYCNAIGSTTGPQPALAEVCKYAVSLSRKLPDLICDRQTSRYWREHGFARHDEVNSKVAFRDGVEHDADVSAVVSPASASQLGSSASGGEFSAYLQAIFLPLSDTEFKFLREEKLHSIHALVFEFHVQKQNNHLYRLQARYVGGGAVVDYPGYGGEVWLDKSNFRILRLVRQTAEVAPHFPITYVQTIVDYANTPLGDGTSFVVPTNGDMVTCSSDQGYECSHNVVRFTNYHKFRATTRILSEGSH
jgi:VWFA-related protein